MGLSRRGWNNVLIIGALLFMAAVQLPELVRQRNAQHQDDAAIQHLLPNNVQIEQLIFAQVVIGKDDVGQWHADPKITISAAELVERWGALQGTPISDEVVDQLQVQYLVPQSVEVWLKGRDEPVRITLYELPQFWLMRTSRSGWVAISVERNYLFPFGDEDA
ncbi:hypothetical protein [Thaumasiovibrio sp. DFM-14]|uniref:hypothetical protein n=1 Tax=Thaumasiovibrio sp. DFM-14 TaxID=3384792 RepID=UPI0039A0AEE3